MLLTLPMTKRFLPGRIQTFLIAWVGLVAASSLAMGQDRFAVTVGPHEVLAIFGPKGEKAPEISAPSMGVPVTVGDISFQVSYGINSDQHLMAILSPSATDPEDLHFNVMGKSVDADKNATVTLIFSSNLKHVTIDPGVVGRVEVNSHRLRHSRG